MSQSMSARAEALLAHRPLCMFLLAAVSFAVYANSLANGFAYDDVVIIELNSRVHNLGDLRGILLTPYWPHAGAELGLYRPFIILMYALQWAVSGGAPWLFHLVSLLLHAAVTVLAFLLLDRLAGRGPAFAGALLFGVHPVHTEAVANVVGQAELVTALAVMMACVIHATRPAGARVSVPRQVALAALFAMALLTKENGVVLPAMLILVDMAQRRLRPDFGAVIPYVRAMAAPVLLLTAVLAAYMLLRLDVMSGHLIGVDAAPSLPYLREEHRLLNAFRAIPEFVRLLFIPMNLSADYSPGVILPVEAWTPMAALGLGLLLGITLLALLLPWFPAVGFPAAWFLVGIITVANLLFPIGVLVAERTLYLASFAVSALVAYGLRAVFSEPQPDDADARLPAQPASVPAPSPAALSPVRTRQLIVAGLALVLVVFSGRTWTRNPDWKSTDSIMMALFRDYPESYRVQWQWADRLASLGRIDEAEAHFTLAFRLYSRDSQLQMAYGAFLVNTGRTEQGLAVLEAVHREQDAMLRPLRLLAHAYLVVGRYDDALSRVDHATAVGLDTYAFHPLRAYAHHGRGDHAAAIVAWEAAIAAGGHLEWAAHAFHARALALDGRPAPARQAIGRALDLAADEPSRERLHRFVDALGDGCFDRPRAGDPGPVVPACDPLGDWFVAISQAQVETALHRLDSVPVRRGGQDTPARP